MLELTPLDYVARQRILTWNAIYDLIFECVQVFFDGKRCQQGSEIVELDVDATDMYGPETITMRGLQSETFGYYVHIYTNGVCWDKISANVKIYQASTGGLLYNINQPGCSESKKYNTK